MPGFEFWNPLQKIKQPRVHAGENDDSESTDLDDISIGSSVLMMEELEREERERKKKLPRKFGKNDINRPNSRLGKGPRVNF